MKREYYFCCSHLDEKDYYFIWFSDEEDGVYLNSESKFVVSNDLENLVIYAKKQKLLIKAEKPVFYNLDNLERTLLNEKFEVDCVEFINIWNLFDDISNSINGNFNSESKSYRKNLRKTILGK